MAHPDISGSLHLLGSEFITLYVEEGEEEWVYVEPACPGEVMSTVPCVGSYCRLVLPDRRRFTGRITRVVEYQRTRIILWVEHPYSPAIVTIAVPYPDYEGTRWWYVGLLRWFGQSPKIN
ncbi:hypothetical protein ACG7TL_005414 [Trametes sanguinea]